LESNHHNYNYNYKDYTKKLQKDYNELQVTFSTYKKSWFKKILKKSVSIKKKCNILNALQIGARNKFAIPLKENVVPRHRIFFLRYRDVVRPEHQRTAAVTPISPSMPIYADVYLTRYQKEVDAPLLLRKIKDTRAPRRGPYM